MRGRSTRSRGWRSCITSCHRARCGHPPCALLALISTFSPSRIFSMSSLLVTASIHSNSVYVIWKTLALLAFSRPPQKWPIGIHEKRAEKASGAVSEWPATRTAALTMPASRASKSTRTSASSRSMGQSMLATWSIQTACAIRLKAVSSRPRVGRSRNELVGPKRVSPSRVGTIIQFSASATCRR